MDDGSFFSDSQGRCCVCGKLTHRVDYCYEDWVCSQECAEILDREVSDSGKNRILHDISTEK